MTQNRSVPKLALALAITGLSLLSAHESRATLFPTRCSWAEDAVYKYYQGETQVGYKRVFGCNSPYDPAMWGYQTSTYTTTCLPCADDEFMMDDYN